MIKQLANQLLSMGFPSDMDLLYFTLGGIGSDYESFITTVSLQADTIPFENLYSLLQNHELRLSSIHNGESNSITALTVTTPSPSLLGP